MNKDLTNSKNNIKRNYEIIDLTKETMDFTKNISNKKTKKSHFIDVNINSNENEKRASPFQKQPSKVRMLFILEYFFLKKNFLESKRKY